MLRASISMSGQMRRCNVVASFPLDMAVGETHSVHISKEECSEVVEAFLSIRTAHRRLAGMKNCLFRPVGIR